MRHGRIESQPHQGMTHHGPHHHAPHHHGGHSKPGHHGHRGGGDHRPGAQTFRRGRALAFLETLNVKRATLMQQLEQPELQSIHPVISGELKAVETVRNEFIAMFELHEPSVSEAELAEDGLDPGESASDGGKAEA